MEGFLDLVHLGLHQKLHVECNLAAGAGHEPEEATDFGDAVAHRVPGDFRLPEL
jgi:hypothetical protein